MTTSAAVQSALIASSLPLSSAAATSLFSAALRALLLFAPTAPRSFSMGPGFGLVFSSSRILASAVSAHERASSGSSSTPRMSPIKKPMASIRSIMSP
eukprot:1019093-Prymnesium_polylepis.1